MTKADSPCGRRPLVLVAVVPSLSVTSVAHDVVTVHVLGASWMIRPVDGSPPTEEWWMHQTEDAVVSSRLLMFPLAVNDSVELACVEWQILHRRRHAHLQLSPVQTSAVLLLYSRKDINTVSSIGLLHISYPSDANQHFPSPL